MQITFNKQVDYINKLVDFREKLVYFIQTHEIQ